MRSEERFCLYLKFNIMNRLKSPDEKALHLSEVKGGRNENDVGHFADYFLSFQANAIERLNVLNIEPKSKKNIFIS